MTFYYWRILPHDLEDILNFTLLAIKLHFSEVDWSEVVHDSSGTIGVHLTLQGLLFNFS